MNLNSIPEERGTGYIHEEPTLFDRVGSSYRSFRVDFGFEPETHPTFKDFFPGWDQSVGNSCTDVGIKQVVTAMAASQGIEHDELSILDCYAWSRIKRRGSAGLDIDEGARVSDTVWAFNNYGPASEKFWRSKGLTKRELLQKIASQPGPLTISSAKANKRILRIKLKRIVDNGNRLIERILHSLDQNQPVVVACPVGNSFIKAKKDDVIGLQDGSRGRHLFGLYDWRLTDDGYELLCGNSYGRDWADDGMAWCKPEFIKQSSATYYLEKIAP